MPDHPSRFVIEPARPEDVPEVLRLIRALAEYERLSHLVVGTEAMLLGELFGPRPVIECLVAFDADGGGSADRGRGALGFALFFHNFSTFLARPGLYLEDLFVEPEARGRGIGRALILRCAQRAVERGCGRFEWSVLDWNRPAIDFYRALGAEVLTDWRICRVTGEALARLGAAGR